MLYVHFDVINCTRCELSKIHNSHLLCFVQFISMACQVFAGNLDACSLRYVLLMTNLVSIVNWAEPEDFIKFASAAYPFLGVCMSDF
jgi:hypothetical protein